MSEYLLEMKGISKSFPGVKALQNVEFQLKAGEIHALLGENGAGKSTLIKVLGGIYIAEEGEILIDGKPVVIDGVHAARENGISIIHQELVLVPHMTVAENIFLGREPMGKLGVDYRKMAASAQEMLDKFDLGISATDEIFDLSIAQQQMVEIVKAISFNCRILVMDEPTSSISDREVAQLFEIMRNLAAQGVGIIYISHKMSELNEVCDRTGGDEFAIIGCGNYSPDKIQEHYRYIYDYLTRYNASAKKGYTVGVSLGCFCEVPDENEPLDKYIKIADTRMYENKVKRKKLRED